jgi:hypothetical protein
MHALATISSIESNRLDSVNGYGILKLVIQDVLLIKLNNTIPIIIVFILQKVKRKKKNDKNNVKI